MVDYKALLAEKTQLETEQRLFEKLAKAGDKDAKALLAVKAERIAEIDSELASKDREVKLAQVDEKLAKTVSELVSKTANELGIDFAFRFGVRVLPDGKTESFSRASLIDRQTGKLSYNGRELPEKLSVNWGANGDSKTVDFSLSGKLESGKVFSTYQQAFQALASLYKDASGKVFLAVWKDKDKYHKESARERLARIDKRFLTLDNYFDRQETASDAAASELDKASE